MEPGNFMESGMARKPTTTKKPRKSTTGKHNPRVDMATWRRKVQKSRVKLDDDAKEIYLAQLREHGLKGKAAEAAGVALSTVRGHLDADPDFNEAVNEAIEGYHDRVVDHHQTLLFEGEIHKRYKDGELVEEKHVYPIPLIQLELKKVDPTYREKQSIDLNHAGGVMVAPPDMSVEEWIEQQRKLNEDRSAPDGADDDSE
jgi:hypothetical protein